LDSPGSLISGRSAFKSRSWDSSYSRIFEKNISGLFHATGKSCINRYELALILADIFHLDKKFIKPVTSKEKNQDAPRPTSTCLDSSKLEKLTDFNFSEIQNGISFIFKKSKI